LIGKQVKSPQLWSKQGFVISASVVENSLVCVVILYDVEDLVVAVDDAALVIVRFGVSTLVVYSKIADFVLKSDAVVVSAVVCGAIVEVLASEIAEVEVSKLVVISVAASVIDAVVAETVASVFIDADKISVVTAVLRDEVKVSAEIASDVVATFEDSVLSVVMTLVELTFAAEVVTIIDVAASVSDVVVFRVEKLISECGSLVVCGLASDSLKTAFF